MKSKIYTKRPMAMTALRLPPADLDLARAAASKLGISVSQLLRDSMRPKARRILREEPASPGGEPRPVA